MSEDLTLDQKVDMSLDEIIGLEKKKKREPARRRQRSRSPRGRSSPYERSSRHRSTSSGGTRVYVGNIPWSLSWRELKDHMKSAGHVVRADIMQDGDRSKGCGIVEFSSVREARRAIEELNDTKIGQSERPIFVREDREPPSNGRDTYYEDSRRSVDRHERSPRRDRHSSPDKNGRQLFVDNLPYSLAWQLLKDHFKKYGDVEKADVIHSKNGRPAGRGTVLFYHASDMQRALREANETTLSGRTIYVKEDRYV